jgi:hypothetical protein
MSREKRLCAAWRRGVKRKDEFAVTFVFDAPARG